MFDDLDTVKLLKDIPEHGLHIGQVGTVLEVFSRPSPAYLVEFCNEDGETIVMIPLLENQISLEWSIHQPRLAA